MVYFRAGCHPQKPQHPEIPETKPLEQLWVQPSGGYFEAGGQAEEAGEEDDIGEVDDGQREKTAIILQVGLVTRNDPEGPQEVKAPRRSQNSKKELVLPGYGVEMEGDGR